MMQSMLEVARNNPFGSPVAVAQCEPRELVPGRTIAAASVPTNPDGNLSVLLMSMQDQSLL